MSASSTAHGPTLSHCAQIVAVPLVNVLGLR